MSKSPANQPAARETPPAARPRQRDSGMRKSMHDGVDASCDCCSCEAEPYWIAAMAESDRRGQRD
ncbi:MAG: hypothetical protein QNJ91_11750 [Gammaproteobacteria bacterium]|nr:hypothetical protein [Gammaproteobacteria bacterium]